MDLPTSLQAVDAFDPDLSRSLYGLGLPADPTLTAENRAIADAFRARADAHMARGEYHLALADYGRALNTSPRNFGLERNPAATAGRRKATDLLDHFFLCGGDPARLPPDTADDVRAAVRSARLPAGHLVVADGGGILAAYPLSDEGRAAAVANADALAADSDARSVVDNLYLAETDDFGAVVYACQAGKAVEVHRAALRPADANPGPAGD